MAKIVKIKNNTGEQKTWLGQVFEDQELIEIVPSVHAKWASSADVIAAITSGDIVVNDGFVDLDAANGARYLYDSPQVYQITGFGDVESEPMGFAYDATRNNKILSSESFTLVYSENKITNMDWVQIGGASDSDSGYIMPFDGTIIRATAHCENTKGNTFNFHLYINTSSVGSVLQLSGSDEQSAVAINLNHDFNAGDKLRLRGIGSGSIEDTVIVVWIKWRKA